MLQYTWLLFATYKVPCSFSKDIYFSLLDTALYSYDSKFKNALLMGDLHTTNADQKLVEFLEDHVLSTLVNFLTCFVTKQ